MDPQPPVEVVIVSLFGDNIASPIHRVVAPSVRAQMAACLADVVRGDHYDEVPIRVAQNVLRNNVQRMAVFVRWLANAIPVVADDIQKVAGAEIDIYGYIIGK